MAGIVGFEPTDPLRGQRLSRSPHSTTLPYPQEMEPPVGIEPTFMLYESIVLPLNEGGITRHAYSSQSRPGAFATSKLLI